VAVKVIKGPVDDTQLIVRLGFHYTFVVDNYILIRGYSEKREFGGRWSTSASSHSLVFRSISIDLGDPVLWLHISPTEIFVLT
jgi:hypothetical protein